MFWTTKEEQRYRQNKLKNLDFLPDSLEILFAGNNQKLLNLDNLNIGLKELECEHCYLLNLDNLPKSLFIHHM